MAWSTPITHVTSYTVTAADWNELVNDLKYLKGEDVGADGGVIVENRLIARTTSANQLEVGYDGSNHLQISVANDGGVTYNATGAGAGHTFNEAVVIAGGGIDVTGNSVLAGIFTLTSTTANQLRLRYDGSNHLQVSIASDGGVTYNATGAGAGHTFSDAVVIVAGGIDVTGGIVGTLSTAAQANVTSLGTLTGLTCSGLITSTLSTGDLFRNISCASATSQLVVGQGTNNKLQFQWEYNATAGNAKGYISTFGYSNRLDIDALTLYLNSNSGTAVTIGAGGVTVSGGGITVTGNSTITGTLGGLTSLTVASGTVSLTQTASRTVGQHHVTVDGTYTATATLDTLSGINVGKGFTVDAATTTTRAVQLQLQGATATVNGTLTNHNVLYCGTPVNGSTVRVIDTASGGYLTTTGVWTDNPSWLSLKRDVTPVTAPELDDYLTWLATAYRPIRYRVADAWENVQRPIFEDRQLDDGRVVQVQIGTKTERVLARYSCDDVDYPQFGYALDDTPEWFRQIVCADAGGGISGKDERGFLLALVARLSARVQALELRPAFAGGPQ